MRRSERIASDIPMVWVRGSRRIDCSAGDMSLHGFFLRCADDIEPGTLMQLRVTLPSRTFSLFGVARFVGKSSAGPGVGVEIFLIDRPGEAAWTAHYRSLLWQRAQAMGAPQRQHRQSWQQETLGAETSAALAD